MDTNKIALKYLDLRQSVVEMEEELKKAKKMISEMEAKHKFLGNLKGLLRKQQNKLGETKKAMDTNKAEEPTPKRRKIQKKNSAVARLKKKMGQVDLGPSLPKPKAGPFDHTV